jgi:hypothetical protein
VPEVAEQVLTISSVWWPGELLRTNNLGNDCRYSLCGQENLISRLRHQAVGSSFKATGQRKHLLDHEFQTVINKSGSVLRALGVDVSGLQYEFEETSIKDAEANIKRYFSRSLAGLNEELVLRLHALEVTGFPWDPVAPLVPSVDFTLENLENLGFLALVRSSADYTVTVIVQEYVLKSWSDYFASKFTRETHSLFAVGTLGGQGFEEFVARYHCLKMNMLTTLNVGRSITLADFYCGAIFKDCNNGDLQLKLPVDHYCTAMNRVGPHFLGSQEDDATADRLLKGDVLWAGLSRCYD